MVHRETSAQGVPIRCETPTPCESTELSRRDLIASERAGGDQMRRVKADVFRKGRDIFDHQLVFEDARCGGLGQTTVGIPMSRSWLGHGHHALRAEQSEHLAEYFSLIRNVMKRVVDDDSVAHTIVKGNRMPVIGHESRGQRPVGPRVTLEQSRTERERAGGDVDRDRVTPESIEKM